MEARKKVPVVVVDLDGTLADTTTIIHYVAGLPKAQKNYEAFHQESAHVPPIPMVQEWIKNQYLAGNQIVYATGRKEQWRELSLAYIAEHTKEPALALYMRPDDDERSQVEWKTEMIGQLIEQYDVKGAIEDRPPIVEVWKDHGIPVVLVPGWV